MRTRCKTFAVMTNGRCGSATYVDTLRREHGRWRISHRTVLARRTPLNADQTAGPGNARERSHSVGARSAQTEKVYEDDRDGQSS